MPIGNGSSRMVFAIDNEKVLKLAKNRKGTAQNKAEFNNCNDYYAGDMFTKVFEYDDQYFTYIIAERAMPVRAADFRNIMGVDYKYFCHICMGAFSQYSRYSYDNLDDNDYQMIEDNEDLNSWYDYISNYQPISVYEITRKANLGVVNRNGRKEIVIVDSGFNNDVANMYRKVNEAVSKVILKYLY